jgi:ATP-dependent RNA helicase RhlE
MTVTFDTLSLRPELLDALNKEGYTTATPIQERAIPAALSGRNILGLAQTGTGKTAAFLLPILQHLSTTPSQSRSPRALVLAPTRDLAVQILASAKSYARFLRVPYAMIVGGVPQEKQVNDLKRGVDLLIATPGRLVDLMEQRLIDLTKIEIFVLDEADRMLDIGFLPNIKTIAKALPQDHQTLFFSATMDENVMKLAKNLLIDPVRIEVNPVATTAEKIRQQVIMVRSDEKRQVLADLMHDPKLERVMIFTRTKHGADRVAKLLEKMNVPTGIMHSRKSQNARLSALKAFGNGKIRAIVATDIAARGIDVDGVSHVINYELPNEPDSYVHRIGRTARAGKSGIAIALCANDERGYLRGIERLIRQELEVIPQPAPSGFVVPASTKMNNSDLDGVDVVPLHDRKRPARSGKKLEGADPFASPYAKRRTPTTDRTKSSGFKASGPRNNRSYAKPAAATADGDYRTTPEQAASPRSDRPTRTGGYGNDARPHRGASSDRKSSSERGAYGERSPRGERSERPAYGERSERPAYGERSERGARPAYGERKPRGASSGGGYKSDARSSSANPDRANGPQRGPRPGNKYGSDMESPFAARGDRPQRSDRPQRAERSSYGEDRPQRSNSSSASKPAYGKTAYGKPAGGKPADGKPAYGKSSAGGRPSSSAGAKGSSFSRSGSSSRAGGASRSGSSAGRTGGTAPKARRS